MAVTGKLIRSSWPGIAGTASFRSPMPGRPRRTPHRFKTWMPDTRVYTRTRRMRDWVPGTTNRTCHFFSGAAGLSVDGSGAGGGWSSRWILAALRSLSTRSACARWAT